jgi:hypothetical protein
LVKTLNQQTFSSIKLAEIKIEPIWLILEPIKSNWTGWMMLAYRQGDNIVFFSSLLSAKIDHPWLLEFGATKINENWQGIWVWWECWSGVLLLCTHARDNGGDLVSIWGSRGEQEEANLREETEGKLNWLREKGARDSEEIERKGRGSRGEQHGRGGTFQLVKSLAPAL